MIEVISMCGSSCRSNILKQLSNIEFEYFDAIFNSDEIRNSFDDLLARLVYGRELRIGERGCALSHRAVIDKFSNSLRPRRVILEDDAIVTSEFFRFVEGLNKLKFNIPTILILGHAKTIKENHWWQRVKQPFFEIEDFNSFKFGTRPFVNFFGTVGYALDYEAAVMIKKLPRTFWLADDWKIFANAGISIYHVVEPLVYEDLSTPSSTGNIVRPLHSLFSRNFFIELWEAFKVRVKKIV